MGQGIQGINPNQGKLNHTNTSGKNLETNIKSATEAMKEAAVIFDTEAQGVSKSQLNKKAHSAIDTHHSDSKKMLSSANNADVYASALAQDKLEELKKKRKKKLASWEEKMTEMESLSELIDTSQVDPEDLDTISQFQENIRLLKRKRREAKEKEEKKSYLKSLLNRLKSQNKQQEKNG